MGQDEFEQWESRIRGLTAAQHRVLRFCLWVASVIVCHPDVSVTRAVLTGWLADVENLLSAHRKSDQSMRDLSVADVLFLRWLRGIGDLTDSQLRAVSAIPEINTETDPISTIIAGAEFTLWLAKISNPPDGQRHPILRDIIKVWLAGTKKQKNRGSRKKVKQDEAPTDCITKSPMKRREFSHWKSQVEALTPVQCLVGRAVLSAKLRGETLGAFATKAEFLRRLGEITGLSDDRWDVVLPRLLGWESEQGVGFKRWIVGIADMTTDQCREALGVVNEEIDSSDSIGAEDVADEWESGFRWLRDTERHLIYEFIAEYLLESALGGSGESAFSFFPETKPFPYWKGPYSPARGYTSGFRVRGEKLGFCAGNERNFRRVEESDGVLAIADLVRRNWRGGRVLFLPSGHVIKPLQEEDERGLRVLIGRYKGGFVCLDGSRASLSPDSRFKQGSRWQGPLTIGLECRIRADSGRLTTQWIEPAEWGDNEYDERIGTDPHLARGFRMCRPGDTGGRVRITVGCHTITNRKIGDEWQCFYVGQADPDLFAGWDRWVARDPP